MKSIATLAAVALLATVSVANAATTPPSNGKKSAVNAADLDMCKEKQTQNAEILSKVQAAKTPAERKKLLQAAIDADPQNAVCLIDMALQMQTAMNGNIQPAAGPEDTGTPPDTTDGTPPPAENPNQLNESTDPGSSSPASPSV